MKSIYEAKEFIKSNHGKKVQAKVLGIRNKNEFFDGILTEIYPNIFVIATKDGNRSFSYSDLFIGNILLQVK